MARTFAAYRRWRGLDGRAETLVLPEGYSWQAALIGPLWAMVRGRWRAAAALGLGWTIAGVLAAAAGPLGAGVIFVVVAIWSGMSARHLEALWLHEQDWRVYDVIAAPDLDTAEAWLIAADDARVPGSERRW